MRHCVSLNTTFKNKLPTYPPQTSLTYPAIKSLWRRYVRSFENKLVTAQELADHVQQGYGYSAQYTRPYRSAAYFMRTGVISIDLDSENEFSTLDTVASLPIIRSFGSFVYTTPSHTPEAPRCRAVFLLDSPINDYDLAKAVIQGVGKEFPEYDEVVHDPVRIFYGSSGCEIRWIGKYLPSALAVRKYGVPILEELAAEQERLQNTAADTSSLPVTSDIFVSQVCSRLASAAPAEKTVGLNIAAYTLGGASAALGLSLEEVEPALLHTMVQINSKNPAHENQRIIRSGFQRGARSPFVPTIEMPNYLAFEQIFS